MVLLGIDILMIIKDQWTSQLVSQSEFFEFLLLIVFVKSEVEKANRETVTLSNDHIT